MDFVVVALIINRNLDMFSSMLGTWLPFGLIFTSAYLTGLAVTKTHHQVVMAHSGQNRQPPVRR
jgi:hypothetical protein